MKGAAKIFAVLLLSFLLIFIGKGVSYVHCAHTRTIGIALLAKSDSKHSSCHDKNRDVSGKCMSYKSISISASEISKHIDFSGIVCDIPSLALPFVTDKGNGFEKQRFKSEIYRPPKDYLIALRVLII